MIYIFHQPVILVWNLLALELTTLDIYKTIIECAFILRFCTLCYCYQKQRGRRHNTLEANTTNSTTCSVLVTYNVIQRKRGLHVLLGGCIQSSDDGYCNVIVNLFFRVLQK